MWTDTKHNQSIVLCLVAVFSGISNQLFPPFKKSSFLNCVNYDNTIKESNDVFPLNKLKKNVIQGFFEVEINFL